ncbi:AraC family transcriptional regulator [Pseudomonas resinovorans]|uniref:AraC family transcriptional regulator n=1 Tax=Metapseudomonas resinovorans TaxID=53412 RepID=A0ABT4Y6A0_METRE|nr:AraC family transcriptional regulator [Pseudomonas resinovorans]MDA8484105.1 AraC family transcriptional regulator [Pseudomonas resinovorans]
MLSESIERSTGYAEARKLARWQEEQALKLILTHLEGSITVTWLADACALSRSDFTRKFKVSTGHSPLEWVRLQRVEKAKRLLTDADRPLAEIGLECGFYDQAHFCRVFNRLTGISPKGWIRQARGAPSTSAS